jgi:hypothetical protein
VPVARGVYPKKKKAKPGEWIPVEYALPDLKTLERLSRGEAERIQQRLFDAHESELETIKRKVKGNP